MDSPIRQQPQTAQQQDQQQLQTAQQQHQTAQQQLQTAQQQLQTAQQHYHDEKMALIQLIGQKVDGLRTSHDSSRREIMSQLSVMDGKLTKPPNPPKTHGFAITRKQLDDDLQELRFIAGQSKYVAKRARAVQGEVIVPFTENGNPIE